MNIFAKNVLQSGTECVKVKTTNKKRGGNVMKLVKKILAAVLALGMCSVALTGCSNAADRQRSSPRGGY